MCCSVLRFIVMTESPGQTLAASRLTIKGEVVHVQALARDVASGRKGFSCVLEDRGTAERNKELGMEENRITVQFSDEWAEACCFIQLGDRLRISRFVVGSAIGPHSPFTAIISPDSEVTVERRREVTINAANVKTFEYAEEAVRQSQSYQTLLLSGHNQYTRMGLYYDAIFGQKGRRGELQWTLQQLHQRHVRRVLDLGCGTGLHAFYFLHNGISTVGVDASETQLAAAQQKNEFLEPKDRVTFISGDITGIRIQRTAGSQRLMSTVGDEIPDCDQFDAVLCMDTLQLLPTMAKVQLAVRTMWHHLRKGGVAIVDIPNEPVPVERAVVQSVSHFPISRDALSGLGGHCLLDEGVLDVIERTYRDNTFRYREWNGFAQQYNKERKTRYTTNWSDRTDELIFESHEIEHCFRLEGFEVISLYGDAQGTDFDQRSSLRRIYVLSRRDMSSGRPAIEE
eukprot:TRINITY_DN10683_c0_g1_i2.p1 TRINITY_DN10683_c0_g1~~TRINITY_DN10683_c0_g1_i2.p1  ORF type:complete len:455 (+),score=62.06 TRINITY_DN10683_c0_g1_i2:440-1804(+)